MLGHALPATADAATVSPAVHSWDTPVLKAATNLNPNPAQGGGDIAVVDGVALLAESGPAGTIADITVTTPTSDQISLYVVRPGDSLAGIAKAFGVSTNTILWANDLKSSKDIHPGDTLVILPISGIKHIVAKGETLATIVKKYKGDMAEVLDFNRLDAGVKLAIGDEIIIPYGVESTVVVPTATSKKIPAEPLHGAGGPSLAGYFISPLPGGYKKTQGLHGYNGVDLGTHSGSAVVAAASGIVTVARASGYNGGYGLYIVISHPNGTQTLYAHLSKVLVTSGQPVSQGTVIGYSGNTGMSTGPHLHFEVRGAANPFGP